jgi:hypothetical protein
MLGLGVNGTKSSAIGVVAGEFVDTVAPYITITASEVTDGDTSSDLTLSLTFKSSEITTNFVASDITVTNGTISGFTGSGKTYTATFTPTASGACTINVAAGTFTDAAGNNNTAADEFNWTYDAVAPTMSITATEVSNGDSSDDESISLTFTSSENTTNFASADITVVNGTISGFTGSGKVYTATFTPTADGNCVIKVNAGVFTDSALNSNTASGDFNWTKTSPAPGVTYTTVYESNSFSTTENWQASASYATITAGQSYTIGSTTYTNLLKLKQNDNTENLLYFYDSDFWSNASSDPYQLDDVIPNGDVKITLEYIYPSTNDQTNTMDFIRSGNTALVYTFSDDPTDFDTLHNEVFEVGKSNNGVFLGFYFENELEDFAAPGDSVYIKSIKIEVKD